MPTISPKYEKLRDEILKWLDKIGIPVDTFELIIKDYSKTYYGCYRTKTNRVYLYYYPDEECTKPYSFGKLMCTAIHEACHVIQHHDPNYVRVRGVMHDDEFNRMYLYYANKLAKEAEKFEQAQKSIRCSGEKLSVPRSRSGSHRSVSGATTMLHRPVLCVANRREK